MAADRSIDRRAGGMNAMRLRRVSTPERFWASLRTNESDVLPLWFTDS
ncbi:MAG: hypothetical protein QOI11_368, partial [Candidatus Eremiobacteraeota bacterium]|nr:hypothetical protein [Candidatus Eremiobacteraeota bacterium]